MTGKVYICMQFFNEYEILKLKLEEIYDVVDYIVITEGTSTHTGIPKPLNFYNNKHLFDKYLGKIIYQPISNVRGETADPNFEIVNQRHDAIIDFIKKNYPWDTCIDHYSRDIFEKESLIAPLIDRCDPMDIIILGDCDEIPRASALEELIQNFEKDKIYHLYHHNYWYYMNLLKTDIEWYGNIALSFENYSYMQNAFCNMRQNKNGIFVPDAGWHFSYMPVNSIRNKMQAITHQDLMTDQVKNGVEQSVKNAIVSNKDLFGRWAKFDKVEINYETHPRYLVDHQDEYKEFILE
jgi:beta-1,4-mannosyl-glycoprotein beta-1,4-N-acetylglucosaminyltransferase